MEFLKLIDKEELILDSKRLSGLKIAENKQELIEKINDIAENFISNNVLAGDFEKITLVYKLINEIKNAI